MAGPFFLEAAVAEISEAQLQAMLEKAAEKGAQRALHSLGLQDDHAAHDVAELRSLLDVWRMIRTSMIKTSVNMITAFILGAIAVGVGLKVWK